MQMYSGSPTSVPDERSCDHQARRPRLQHHPDARRQRTPATDPARRQRRGRLAALHGGPRRPARRDRARASGLRRLRHAGLARQHSRPRQLLSRFSRSARPEERRSRRLLARRLDRGRACGAQHATARLADAGRRRRHPCQRRRAGRFVPAQRRAAHPRLCSTIRSAPTKWSSARSTPGARGHQPQEPDHHRQADLAAARLRSASAQMAASDRRADAADLGRQRPAVSEGLCLRLSAPDPGLEGHHHSGLRAYAADRAARRLSSARSKASSTSKRAAA